MEHLLAAISETINATVAGHPQSAFWRTPLVGTVDAGDERMLDLKTQVSATHLLPRDILPGAKSVVCFFIPFSAALVKSNLGGTFASADWARSYIVTNDLIATLSAAVAVILKKNGHETGTIPATHNFDPARLVSDWSHRHLAHLAGLGSFGLNNMLITDAGCCGRLGSLVTTCPLPSSDGQDEKERCLFKLNGSCGVCEKKCVTTAFADGSYNRHICYDMCLQNAARHQDIGYADVCGKCTAGLPCSLADPVKRIKNEK